MDLSDYINFNKNPSYYTKLKLIYYLLRGIKCLYCDECRFGNIIHCDLKLENILISKMKYNKKSRRYYYTIPDKYNVNNLNLKILIFLLFLN